MNAQTTPPKFRQVIKIDPSGAMHGLQKKPNQGIDLRQFGSAKIERVTDIRHDEEKQKWYVTFLRGELKDQILSFGLFDGVVHDNRFTGEETMYFDDYDDAVASEIAFLDTARSKGMYPELFRL